MNKFLPLFLVALAVTAASWLALSSPVRDSSAAREFSCSSDPEPRNTDYLRTSDGVREASQLTHVNVGYDTDFSVGARLVVDITVVGEWKQDYFTVFAVINSHGYEWCRLSPAENLRPGRYTIEWINEDATGGPYHLRINDGYSLESYTTWWQLQNKSYPLYIGSRYQQSGWTFTGLYHSIKLYDSTGVLRHKWIPDPSGNFYDEIDGVFASRVGGYWTYGDLANE